MPKATILFVVPQDFSSLQSVISDFPGECDRIDFEDLDNLDSQLRALVGEMIEIEFDEPHDPAEPVDAIVAALRQHDAPFLAVVDSYTEQSRNTRFQARVVVRTADFEADKQFPWADGEPDISDRGTFLKAGFTDHDVRSIDAVFFPLSTPHP